MDKRMDNRFLLGASCRFNAFELVFLCSPNGIRTRVATLRGWCPWPLDDGAERRFPEGFRRCSGGRTRTLNNWTRTSRVADYTTPEWVDDQVSRGRRGHDRPLFGGSATPEGTPGKPRLPPSARHRGASRGD